MYKSLPRRESLFPPCNNDINNNNNKIIIIISWKTPHVQTTANTEDEKRPVIHQVGTCWSGGAKEDK